MNEQIRNFNYISFKKTPTLPETAQEQNNLNQDIRTFNYFNLRPQPVTNELIVYASPSPEPQFLENIFPENLPENALRVRRERFENQSKREREETPQTLSLIHI